MKNEPQNGNSGGIVGINIYLDVPSARRIRIDLKRVREA